MEFELTSMKIDLRFVDASQEFPFEPKEVCTEIRNDGKVNNFLNRSLNHTNVKLTWVIFDFSFILRFFKFSNFSYIFIKKLL